MLAELPAVVDHELHVCEESGLLPVVGCLATRADDVEIDRLLNHLAILRVVAAVDGRTERLRLWVLPHGVGNLLQRLVELHEGVDLPAVALYAAAVQVVWEGALLCCAHVVLLVQRDLDLGDRLPWPRVPKVSNHDTPHPEALLLLLSPLGLLDPLLLTLRIRLRTLVAGLVDDPLSLDALDEVRNIFSVPDRLALPLHLALLVSLLEPAVCDCDLLHPLPPDRRTPAIVQSVFLLRVGLVELPIVVVVVPALVRLLLRDGLKHLCECHVALSVVVALLLLVLSLRILILVHIALVARRHLARSTAPAQRRKLHLLPAVKSTHKVVCERPGGVAENFLHHCRAILDV
mmetsp:Transcript_7670/g.19211  ORF Transcript_7670/g.19211 Transcript_7670/m.19211 type:complete len:347 (-) Transcript_7670:217-1257(-)